MSVRSLLESFEDRAAANGQGPFEEAKAGVDLSLERSRAFEAGYTSGWEDAQKSDENASNRVTAEFERNIESLAFTYHEAVDLLRVELFSFVDAVIQQFLPDLLPELTREHVRSELLKIGEEALITPIELVVSSDCRPLLEGLMNEDLSIEITLIEDCNLAEHQVFIRSGAVESSIDLGPLVDMLREQLLAVTVNNAEGSKEDARA